MIDEDQVARVRRVAKVLGVDESLLLRIVETGAFNVNYLALMGGDRDRRPSAGAGCDTGTGDSS
jgi:hypothetical protein